MRSRPCHPSTSDMYLTWQADSRVLDEAAPRVTPCAALPCHQKSWRRRRLERSGRLSFEKDVRSGASGLAGWAAINRKHQGGLRWSSDLATRMHGHLFYVEV